MMRQKKQSTPSKTTFISNVRVQADQKDIILDKLRSQAEALKKNQKQFVLLKQQYADLDRKYRAQLEQKSLQDNDFKNRHDGALRHIGQLRNQAEAIKAELRDKKLQIQDLRAEQQTFRHSIDQRNIDLQKLRIEINALLCDSDQLQNQRISFVQQVQSLRKANSILSQDLFNLQKQNQACNSRLAELQKYLQQLQTQSILLKQKIKSYEDTNNEIDTEIQIAINELSQMQNLLYQSQRNLTQLQAANASIATNVDQYKSESMHNQKAAQAQIMKNNDLVKKLKQSQNALRIRVGQVEEGHNQISSLKQQNQNLQKINNELFEDLQACRKHLQNLGLLNHQLISSLQSFSQQDMKAAQLINREHRVKYLDSRVRETSSVQYYSGKQTARTDVSFNSSRRKTRF